MRKRYSDPLDGEKRVVSRFCLFPKHLDGMMVWLERARIEQRYDSNYADDGWKNVRFV